MVRSPSPSPGSLPRRTDTSLGRTHTGYVDSPFSRHTVTRNVTRRGALGELHSLAAPENAAEPFDQTFPASQDLRESAFAVLAGRPTIRSATLDGGTRPSAVSRAAELMYGLLAMSYLAGALAAGAL